MTRCYTVVTVVNASVELSRVVFRCSKWTDLRFGKLMHHSTIEAVFVIYNIRNKQ